MKGVYLHCNESICTAILRNLISIAKLDVTDAMRSDNAMQGIVEKRFDGRRPRKTESTKQWARKFMRRLKIKLRPKRSTRQ
jgi:hypothetical protein